jgi:hypothetical protein
MIGSVSARSVALAAIAALCCLASCGGGDGDSTDASLPADHKAVLVIENWIGTLSDGDVEGAAGYFALPSVTQNGTAPVTLRSRSDATAFNSSLPCGAELLRARPVGLIIVATFRLTERPGGDCGSGVGQLARTAFVIRDGKIVQWRRLLSPPGGPGGGSGGKGPIV